MVSSRSGGISGQSIQLSGLALVNGSGGSGRSQQLRGFFHPPLFPPLRGERWTRQAEGSFLQPPDFYHLIPTCTSDCLPAKLLLPPLRSACFALLYLCFQPISAKTSSYVHKCIRLPLNHPSRPYRSRPVKALDPTCPPLRLDWNCTFNPGGKSHCMLCHHPSIDSLGDELRTV